MLSRDRQTVHSPTHAYTHTLPHTQFRCVGRSLDHHLTIVGFTAEAWIAKSSWGTQWGEGGYIRLARGQNMCGLADWALVPIVAG